MDQEIIQVVQAKEPAHAWSVINDLTKAEGPLERTEARAKRRHLWARVAELISRGLLHYEGRNKLTTSKPPEKITRRRMFRRVARKGAPRTGSEICSVSQKMERLSPQEVDRELTRPQTAPKHPDRITDQSESLPTNQEITAAARSLAQLPRRSKRRWTGFFAPGVRGYRDQVVVQSDGTNWYLYGIRRGKAVLTKDRGQLLGGPFGDGGPLRWKVVPVSEVKPLKDPGAQLLGRMKRGKTERPSAVKAATARANGRMPCRPGRRRGRPRKTPLKA